MSLARRVTFGELSVAVKGWMASGHPPQTFIEQLEEAITFADLIVIFEQYLDSSPDEVIPDKLYLSLRNFLDQRWGRIRDYPFLQYQHNTASPANRACIELAFVCQAAFNQGMIQLLIPEIESPVSLITTTDLSDGNTPISHIVLSDDHRYFIEPKESLLLAVDEGVLHHTQLLDENHQPVRLSNNEIFRVIYHSAETRALYRAIQELVKFTHSQSTLGAWIKYLIEGLRAGGSKVYGDEYDAAANANIAILNFSEIYASLPTETQHLLNEMGASSDYDYNFRHWWNILAKNQELTIDRIKHDDLLTDEQKSQSLELIHQSTSTCVEITAGRLDTILESNKELLYSIPVDQRGRIDSITQYDDKIKRCTEALDEKLNQIALDEPYVALWNDVNVKTSPDATENYIDRWLSEVEPEKLTIILNTKDANGISVLTQAIKTNQINIVRALLERSTDQRNPSYKSMNMLEIAIASNQTDIIALLLPTEPDELHHLFSTYIRQQPVNLPFMEYLIQNHQIDVNTTLDNGDTPLIIAARTQSLALVNILLTAKANTNETLLQLAGNGETAAINFLVKDSKVNINTALLLAAEREDIHLVQSLITHGGDITTRNQSGQTILRQAAFHGQTEMIETLLANRTQRNAIDAKDANGNTALMWAARRGHLYATEALLNHGAKLDIVNHDQLTALELSAHHLEIAALLAKKMIEAYRNKRELGGRFTGCFFGCSKETKITAANAVMNMIDSTPDGVSYSNHLKQNLSSLYDKHRRALNQGELGKIFNTILGINPQPAVTITSKMMRN